MRYLAIKDLHSITIKTDSSPEEMKSTIFNMPELFREYSCSCSKDIVCCFNTILYLTQPDFEIISIGETIILRNTTTFSSPNHLDIPRTGSYNEIITLTPLSTGEVFVTADLDLARKFAFKEVF